VSSFGYSRADVGIAVMVSCTEGWTVACGDGVGCSGGLGPCGAGEGRRVVGASGRSVVGCWGRSVGASCGASVVDFSLIGGSTGEAEGESSGLSGSLGERVGASEGLLVIGGGTNIEGATEGSGDRCGVSVG
jgi:hypothetical protein